MAGASAWIGSWTDFFAGDGAEQQPPPPRGLHSDGFPRSELVLGGGVPRLLGGTVAPGPGQPPPASGNLSWTPGALFGGGHAGVESEPQPIQRRVNRERVLVRVYDLGQTFITRNLLNRVTKQYGAFHTGVEVYGREWSFGMTLDDWSTGVTWNPPGQNIDHTFRETLSMGYTTLSAMEVDGLITRMKEEWPGCSYQILTRNCHHFSDEFCRRLGVAGIPDWVNMLATSGASTANFLDSADSGYDGGEAVVDFLRNVGSRMFSALSWNEEEEHDSDAYLRGAQHEDRHPQHQQQAQGWDPGGQQRENPDPFGALRR